MTLLDLASAANAGAGWAIGALTRTRPHGLPTLSRAPHTHLCPYVATRRPDDAMSVDA